MPVKSRRVTQLKRDASLRGKKTLIPTCNASIITQITIDTIAGFKEIVDGKCDNIPEVYFYNVGTIQEAKEKAKAAKK